MRKNMLKNKDGKSNTSCKLQFSHQMKYFPIAWAKKEKLYSQRSAVILYGAFVSK